MLLAMVRFASADLCAKQWRNQIQLGPRKTGSNGCYIVKEHKTTKSSLVMSIKVESVQIQTCMVLFLKNLCILVFVVSITIWYIQILQGKKV